MLKAGVSQHRSQHNSLQSIAILVSEDIFGEELPTHCFGSVLMLLWIANLSRAPPACGAKQRLASLGGLELGTRHEEGRNIIGLHAPSPSPPSTGSASQIHS